MNPLLIGGGAAALLALLMLGPSKAKAAGPVAPRRPPNTTPAVVALPDEIKNAICEATSGGTTSVLTEPFVAMLWARFYPTAPWPTIPADHSTVLDAEMLLREEVALYLDDPLAYCKSEGGGINLHEVESDTPQPGYHYQIKQGELVNGVGDDRLIYSALHRAGVIAQLEVGADPAIAEAFGKALAGNAQARARYRNMLYCDLYNDMYMGTYGYDAKLGQPGPNGRRFRNLPQHEDNRTRISLGLSPMRRTPLMTPADAGKGNANAKFGKLPYPHFPLLDYERLRQDDLPIDARLVYGKYADGSSGALPPPAVQRIMSTVGLPKIIYGCSGPGYVTQEV